MSRCRTQIEEAIDQLLGKKPVAEVKQLGNKPVAEVKQLDFKPVSKIDLSFVRVTDKLCPSADQTKKLSYQPKPCGKSSSSRGLLTFGLQELKMILVVKVNDTTLSRAMASALSRRVISQCRTT
jgi:hypothetical protein